MSLIGELFFDIVVEFLLAPAEWVSERLWRLHRKEPTWWRVISATVLGVLTVVIYLAWIAVLIGIPIAIVVLATR